MATDILFFIGSTNNKAQTQPYVMHDNEKFTVYAIPDDDSAIDSWSYVVNDNFTPRILVHYDVTSPNSVAVTAPSHEFIGSPFRLNGSLVATSGGVSRSLRLVTQ
jgi:hypothetical protein